MSDGRKSSINIPPATPNLIDSVFLSLNNTRECSNSKGLISSIYYEHTASHRAVTFNSILWLAEIFRVHNINVDALDTGNSHAVEAVNECFKRSFEINALLVITKTQSSSNWSKSTPAFQKLFGRREKFII